MAFVRRCRRTNWFLRAAITTTLSLLLIQLLSIGSAGAEEPTNDVPLDMEENLGVSYSGNLKVFNFFWDDDWDANNPDFPSATIDSMTEALVGSDYFAKLEQYGVTGFDWAGSSEATTFGCDTNPGSNVSTPGLLFGIGVCVTGLAAGGDAPVPDGQTIYNIILPTGTEINDTVDFDFDTTIPPDGTNDISVHFQRISCQDYGAYHVETFPINVTIIPAECFDDPLELVSAISHEVVEAATDPVPLTAWINESDVPLDFFEYVEQFPQLFAQIPALLTEGEAADICEEVPEFLSVPFDADGTDLLVGAYWSNADNACVVGNDRVVLTKFDAPDAPSGGTVDVEGVSQPLNTPLPLLEGASFEFPGIVSGGTGVRYVSGDGCSGTVDFPDPADASNPQPSDQQSTITCAYSTEYELTVSTDPSSLVVGNSSLASGGWFSEGTIVPLNADSPIEAGTGTRYELRSWRLDGLPWSGDSVTMNGPHSVVAQYQLQYEVGFDVTGVPVGVPWHVTTDGVEESGPTSAWVDDGAVITFDFETPIQDPTDAGTRYVWQSNSADSPLTVNGPITVTATYGTEYLLTLGTSGLEGNTTNVWNGSDFLGVASDSSPVVVWIPSDTTLALSVDDPVNGASGIQYFFEEFAPAVPSTMDSAVNVVAVYQTMEQQIADALDSGGINGPGSDGVAHALTIKFTHAQSEMDAGAYADALDDLTAFVNQLSAQSGKKVEAALAVELQLDAAAVYHYAMCQAVSLGQLTPAEHAAAYSYYVNLVTSLGGVVLPDC